MLSSALEQKRILLEARLRACKSLIVAYSGGVDSGYLAYAARQALGDSMLAVLADSPSLARAHYGDAVAFAGEYGIPLRIVQTAELDNADYARNFADRCFHCKNELFTLLDRIRETEGFASIAYGMNLDDRGDFRPGELAARDHHVGAPLVEANLSKSEVRALAQAAGLRIWDKPASACLASRIEYGRRVTHENLLAIERAEDALRDLGFRVFRVRHHGEIARVEIAPEEMMRVFSADILQRIIGAVKAAGFHFVALDLEGYRSGSMNRVLPVEQLTESGDK